MNRRKLMQMAMGALPATVLSQRQLAAQAQTQHPDDLRFSQLRAHALVELGDLSGAITTLEAVANPLVATLFPHNRTHYLNILHASWPAGLIIGGVLGWVLRWWQRRVQR